MTIQNTDEERKGRLATMDKALEALAEAMLLVSRLRGMERQGESESD